MDHWLDKITLACKTWTQAVSMIRQQGDAEKLIELQNRKLRVLVGYATCEVKYYRELFEQAGVKPEEITCREDLAKLPILRREDLQRRFWDFLPQHLPASRLSRTSGSTGQPVCLLADRFSRSANSAAVIRTRRAWGLGPVGGTILAVQKHQKDQPKDPFWTYLQGIHRTLSINPYLDSKEQLAKTAIMLQGLKKVWVMGITPAVERLAFLLADSKLPSFRCAAVMTTGSVLDPAMRQRLEQAFSATVCDMYACNEAGEVAWQCRKGNYHINMENVIVEIVKEGQIVKPGEIGRVVITNLNRRVMPILRYDNGDWARRGQGACPCGCALELIGEIMGRSGQDIVLSDQTVLGWHTLKSVMNDPRVREFQMVQHEPGEILIKCHTATESEKGDLAELIDRRCRKLSEDKLKVTLQWVRQIEPQPSGKRPLVISYCHPRR